MTDSNVSREAQIEEANAQLSEGLKSCRSMVESYRNMIGGTDAANDAERPGAANDDVSLAGEPDESSL